MTVTQTSRSVTVDVTVVSMSREALQLTMEWTVACSVRLHSAMFLARESLATPGSISMKWHSWQPRDRASSPTAPVPKRDT